MGGIDGFERMVGKHNENIRNVWDAGENCVMSGNRVDLRRECKRGMGFMVLVYLVSIVDVRGTGCYLGIS